MGAVTENHGAPRLTTAQRKRLAVFDIEPGEPTEVHVVGWSDKWGGPILRFVTGIEMVITRDGGCLGVDGSLYAS